MLDKENIIVSFTSWKGRIGTVHTVIESILNNTVTPDKIVLNLSSTEFPNKDNELPSSLTALLSNPKFEIFWVEKNTRQFKKIIPTLQRFPDDIIISIDDDYIYDKNFIKGILQTYILYQKQFPVTTWVNTPATNLVYGSTIGTHSGKGTLVKKEFFGNYLFDIYNEFVEPKLLEGKIRCFDDTLYTYSMLLNEKEYKVCNINIGKPIPTKDNGVSNNNMEALKNWHSMLLAHIKNKYGKTYVKGVGFNAGAISFIIPNRDGKHLDEVIKNIEKTYAKYKHEIIIVEQDNNDIFKKGQILNVAVHFAKYQFLCFIDNDVVSLRPLDIPSQYKKFGGPFCAFDKVSQITIMPNGSYKITKTESRPNGFGAYTIISKRTYIEKNGYSNLCFGWGSEDEIMHHSMKYKRLIQNIGHITHARRINLNVKNTQFNRKLLKLYQEGKINHKFDGMKQTTFHISSLEKNDSITKIKVDSVDVVANYVYKNYLNMSKSLYPHSQEKIIVTMTTWKGRIANLPVVLGTILNQTKKPDKIVINFSEEEFGGKLPESTQKFINEHPIIEAHWIKGKNTKQWKKTIPTMLRYPKDCIICIDDDRKYSNNFIDTLWNAHLNYPNGPVTVNNGYKLKGKYLQHAGHGTLDKLEFYNGFKGIDFEPLYNMPSSDSFFTLIANNYGHPLKYAPGTKIAIYNETEPLKKTQGTCSISTHNQMYDYLIKNGIINLNSTVNRNVSKIPTVASSETANSASKEKSDEKRILMLGDSGRIGTDIKPRVPLKRTTVAKKKVTPHSAALRNFLGMI